MQLFPTNLPVWKTSIHHLLVKAWHSEPEKFIAEIILAKEHHNHLNRVSGEKVGVTTDQVREARTIYDQNSTLLNAVALGKLLAVWLRSHDMLKTSGDQLQILLENTEGSLEEAVSGSISIPIEWADPLVNDGTPSRTEGVRTLFSYARERHVKFSEHATDKVLASKLAFTQELVKQQRLDKAYTWKTVGGFLRHYQHLMQMNDYYIVIFDAHVLNRWASASANEKTRMISTALTDKELEGLPE